MDQNARMEYLCAAILKSLDRFDLDVKGLTERLDRHEQLISAFSAAISGYQDNIPKKLDSILSNIDRSIDEKLADTDFAIADNNNLFKSAAVRLNEEIRNSYVDAVGALLNPIEDRLNKIDENMSKILESSSKS
ncbi:hypothetical protein D3273_15155 [Lichenibacterium minor]|uniref:Uncharacterized protein n=1 Tax=Lichenibacterium minor TaxID=2316528 RepID=A0A4Q2U8E4_9HYPH|nr:hypothetical protein [Lichenibacterium minor]RYC31226.1 hypothetical protein D3273_15155 [Lichenibacterium minor]